MARPRREVVVRGRPVRIVYRAFKHLFGRTYPGRGEIELDRTLKGVPHLSTLLHEALHNLNWGLAEKRVLHLEYALVNLVLSNPELFKELAEHAPSKPRRRRR